MEEKMTIQQETVSAFINNWIALSKPDTILHLKIANWNTFPSIENPNIHTITQPDSEEIQSKNDLIIGDLPIGMMTVDYDYHGEKLRVPRNWKEILHSLDYLNDTGAALYVLEPMGFGTEKGKRFETILNMNCFYISAYIRLPEGILGPTTTVTPIIVVIRKQESKKVFADELLDPTQAEYLADNYFFPPRKESSEKSISEHSASTKKVSENIESYSTQVEDIVSENFILPGVFQGFGSLKTQRQIERLQSQYKNYSQRALGELAIEVNSVPSGGTFIEIPNSIYIPKIGKQPVVSDLKDVTIKHQNCFQVVLDQSVKNTYLAAFFRSVLGKLILKSFFSETYISHLNKSGVYRLQVAIPSGEEQLSILRTIDVLSRLKLALDEYESELALNPTTSSSIQPKLDSMLAAIDGLTEVEKVNSLIREGESKRLEFKATLSFDLSKRTREKHLETSVLKTIVAFLNSEGGILLIGVSDDGYVSGLNQEIKTLDSTEDHFKLRLKSLIKEHIGEPYYPFIDYWFIDIDGKKVLFVDCKPSPELECYLDNRDFYVRTNPATDKLEGPELVKYIRNRFRK